MVFKEFKDAFRTSVENLLKNETTVFVVNLTGDQLWETYISAFPSEEQQGYTCNSCRSFLKHYGGIVAIGSDNKLKTAWDFQTEGYYVQVAEALKNLVLSAKIQDVFISKIKKLGTNNNPALLADGTAVRWEHLYCELPSQLVVRDSLSEDAIRGKYRDAKNVFKRSLDELTIDATEIVLELISSNSLYRGAESKAILDLFLKEQKKYSQLSEEDKDNFCWKNSKPNDVVSKIRNAAIGTLLIDISKDVELDRAVGSFERIMAPTNYRRPTALISKRMVEDAEKTLSEAGLLSALDRRFAHIDDVTVNNVIFVDRTKKVSSLLNDLKEDVLVDPKNYSKVDSISLDDFIANVLPKATTLEVLLENKHESNLVSLIAPVDPDSNQLFKWNNKFSWSYNNALADSALKEKVKAAGGKVEGLLRCSLEWYNYDDLDFHLIDPRGEEIYYAHKNSRLGGQLDVDMNAGGRHTRTPVENIIFPYGVKLADGNYKLYVNQFSQRENIDLGFSVEVEYEGNIYTFSQTTMAKGKKLVAEFQYSKQGFTINGELSNKIISKEMWGLNTNKFYKVKNVMYSPNYWDDQGVGNKHTFFILEGAKNDSSVRGFFNEFLKQDLDKHRKVFEVLASKAKVAPSDVQVSGLGFSSTTKNEIFIRVTGTGNFQRVLKVVS